MIAWKGDMRTIKTWPSPHRSPGHSHGETLKSPPFLSQSATESDKSSRQRTCRDRKSWSSRLWYSQSCCHEILSLIQQVSTFFETVLDYSPYPLADQCQHYDVDVAIQISRVAKTLEVHLKTQVFEWFDLIAILIFLSAFQMACDTNYIYREAALCL